MRRIIVDSGSSIKVDEKKMYGVEILPIQLQMGNDFFWDGVNLSTEEFYSRLKDSSQFPKTSLPSLEETQKLVDLYTGQGDEVLIITISSGISGTYQTMKMLFNDYENVGSGVVGSTGRNIPSTPSPRAIIPSMVSRIFIIC